MNIIRDVFERAGKGSADLGGKTVRGAAWVVSLQMTNRAFQLAKTVVLARLLAPQDFGLFGTALLTLSILDAFSQPGFWQALIQKKVDVRPYLNTVWTVGITRSVLIAAALYGASPLIAGFFNVPAAAPIFRIIGLSIVFQNLINIGVVFFEKELEFHKYFFFQLAGTTGDMVVSISAALLLRSVWALVLGRLAGNIISCIVSYIVHPWRPRWSLNLAQAKELFRFGRWILGSNILIFFTSNGDNLFVSKFLGPTSLGFYQMAYTVSNTVATEINRPVSTVMFPAYSILQEDLPRLREVFLRVLRLTAFLAFLTAGLIFATAPNLVLTVLGEKWKPVIPLVMILVFRGMSGALRGALGALTKAIGHPEFETKVTFLQLLLLALLIYPAGKLWGLTGVAIVVVFQTLATLPVALRLILPKIGMRSFDFLKEAGIPFSISCVMTALVYGIQSRLPFNLLTLALEGSLGLLIYFGLTRILHRSLFQDFAYIKNRVWKRTP